MKASIRSSIILLFLVAVLVLMMSSAVSAAEPIRYVYYFNQDSDLVIVEYNEIIQDIISGSGVLRDTLRVKLAAAYNNGRLFFLEFNDDRVINYYQAVFDLVNYPQAYADPAYWWAGSLTPTLKLIIDPVTGQAVEVPFVPPALLEAVSVSVINNETFRFTVEFDEVALANLTGRSLSLSFGTVVAQANFASLAGKVATFTVRSEDRAAMISGDYSLAASWLAPTALTASYNQVIADSGVQGFVYDVSSPVPAPMSDIEVKILDGTQASSTTNGHFLIPAGAGERHVSVKLDNYFTVRRVIPVQRNYISIANINMRRVVISELEIRGEVIDQNSSAVVAGANVVLQRKVGSGSWTTLASVTSDATGNFAFGNSNSSVVAGLSSFVFGANSSGPINMTDQFRVVVEKPLSAGNLDDVYAQKQHEFDISDEHPVTDVLVELRPIAPINSIQFGLTWDPDARNANAGDIPYIRVTMLDRDGVTVLRLPHVFGNSGAETPVRNVLADKMDLMPGDMLDLVEVLTWDGAVDNFFGTIPTLPSGTYYLLVDNADVFPVMTNANARTIVPLLITEGTDFANATAATVMPSRTVRLTTEIDDIYFANSLAANPSANITFGGGANDGIINDLTLIDTDESVSTFAPLAVRQAAAFVTTDYEIFKSVNGTAVRYYSSLDLGPNKRFQVNRGANNAITDFTVSEVTDFINLAAGDYTVYSINSPYIRGTKQRAITAGAAIATPTMSVSSSAKLSKLILEDAGVPIANAIGSVTVELRRGGIVRYSATGLSTNGFGEVGLGSAFAQIEPQQNYTIRILVDGYKDFTSAAFNVMDFAELKGTFTLIPEDDVLLTGYIRFEDTNQSVSQTAQVDATVTAYLFNPVTSRWNYVAHADLAAPIGTATYSFAPGALSNDVPYKLVVRGRGFETVERPGVELVRGSNAQYFLVAPNRGAGKFRFNIVDSLERPLVLVDVDATDSTSDVILRDAWAYDISSSYVADPVGSRGVFDGRYPMHSPTGVVFESTAVHGGVKTGDLLSKGTYTLRIAPTGQTNLYTAMVTIPEFNDTIYRNIYVPVIAGALDVNIVLTVTRIPGLLEVGPAVPAVSNPHASDYVKLYNSSGDLVRIARLDYFGLSLTRNIKAQPNDTYRVVVYADESFMAETTVSVQDFNQPVTLAVDEAVR